MQLFSHHFLIGFLDVDKEHVGIVFAIMSTGFPQVNIEHVGSDDFLVAPDLILLPNELDKVVIDGGTSRVEECTPRGFLVEEQQVLLLGNHPVVIFG